MVYSEKTKEIEEMVKVMKVISEKQNDYDRVLSFSNKIIILEKRAV